MHDIMLCMEDRAFPITKSNFCDPNDFKMMWGIDLDAEMRDGSMTPDAFLARIERQIKQHIDKVTFRVWQWSALEQISQWRQAMQMAILTQAYYVYRNTDIASDSGYDPDKGINANSDVLKKIAIDPEAVDFLRRAGIIRRTLPKNLGRSWYF